MWKAGLKVGPQGWKERLEESKTQYCEIWFNIEEAPSYTEMFIYLKEHHIHTGLHFWGMLDGGILPNLAYPDSKVWKATYDRMKASLDIAKSYDFSYVNIHLGNYALESIDFEKHVLTHIENSEVDQTLAEQTFLKNIEQLHTYAKNLGTMLIVETIPPMESSGNTQEGRSHPRPNHALSTVFLETAAKKLHLNVNNDLGHSAAEFDTASDKEKLWEFLLARTKALEPYIKLIHMNTVLKPFNGTDSHDGITDEDFSKGVFPNKQQIIELLQLFAKRNDVWVINEPMEKHIENYRALLQLQSQMV